MFMQNSSKQSIIFLVDMGTTFKLLVAIQSVGYIYMAATYFELEDIPRKVIFVANVQVVCNEDILTK